MSFQSFIKIEKYEKYMSITVKLGIMTMLYSLMNNQMPIMKLISIIKYVKIYSFLDVNDKRNLFTVF